MLLNIKKWMKRGLEFALKEWRNLDGYKGSSLHRYLNNAGSYSTRLQKKYSRIYEDYWIAASRAKRYHLFNEITIQFIYNTFQHEKLDTPRSKELFCNLEVLVVGCGGGILTESLAEIDFKVTGIDPNPYFIVIAERHKETNKLLFGKTLKYVKATVEEFSKTNSEKFDAIIVSNVLEFDIDYWHKREFLRSCVACCKPGGDIFITTMTPSLKTFLWTFAFDLEANWNAVSHKWYRATSPEALTQILAGVNCQVMEKRGIWLFPEELKFLPDDQIRTWYFLHAKKKAPQQQQETTSNRTLIEN